MTSLNLVKNSFEYHLRVMKIWGLYPFDNYPNVYTFHAFLFYFIFIIPASLLPAIHLVIVRERNMEKITNSLFLILEVAVCLLKFLPFKANPKVIKKAIFALNQDIFQKVSADQMHFIRKTEAGCKNIFVVFLTFCVLSQFTLIIKVIFQGGRTFPVDIWLPFNPFDNVLVYLGVFTYLFMAIANTPIGNAAIDTLIAGLINHAACQLRILKDTILHLSTTMDEREGDFDGLSIYEKQLENDIIYGKICDCIEHYDAIYKFVRVIEETFSFTILSQLAVSIFVICMTCYQLSIAEPLTAPFFSMAILVVCLLLQIFFYCYYGTELYEESDTLTFAIYSTNWYELDAKSKKALIILMERAKRPMQLTIGKVLDLSLATWTMIIRRSYSLLAVLKNYQQI